MQIDVLDLVIHEEMRYEPHPKYHILCGRQLYFIQVGSFDGHSFDPLAPYIHEYHWPGLLIEPHPRSYKELREQYAAETQLDFMEAAIGPHDGRTTLWAFKDGQNLPPHARMLSSVDRWRLEQNGHGYRGELEAFEVDCWTPASVLMRSWAYPRLDLLQVDTKGMDFEIVSGFLATDQPPTIIMFENPTLFGINSQPLLASLESKGYLLHQVGFDIIAYRQRVSEAFRRRQTVTNSELSAGAMR